MKRVDQFQKAARSWTDRTAGSAGSSSLSRSILNHMRILALAALLATSLAAQPKFEFGPGAQYDPAIPTFKKVLGFEPAEKLASPADTVRFLEALAAAQPNRMKVIRYGESWEKRPLVYATISSDSGRDEAAG
jgi:hypothetical protein